mmetsp:Transcript_88423/g.138557  ORF Transcript_88423/g.138557 Transcript_88423/m.138557 type:complete len:324 (+) Transcript_88423:461-1432(+)
MMTSIDLPRYTLKLPRMGSRLLAQRRKMRLVPKRQSAQQPTKPSGEHAKRKGALAKLQMKMNDRPRWSQMKHAKQMSVVEMRSEMRSSRKRNPKEARRLQNLSLKVRKRMKRKTQLHPRRKSLRKRIGRNRKPALKKLEKQNVRKANARKEKSRREKSVNDRISSIGRGRNVRSVKGMHAKSKSAKGIERSRREKSATNAKSARGMSARGAMNIQTRMRLQIGSTMNVTSLNETIEKIITLRVLINMPTLERGLSLLERVGKAKMGRIARNRHQPRTKESRRQAMIALPGTAHYKVQFGQIQESHRTSRSRNGLILTLQLLLR